MKNQFSKVSYVVLALVAVTLLFSLSTTGQSPGGLEKRVEILEGKVKTLEQQVNQLRSVVKVKGPAVTLQAQSMLTVKAGAGLNLEGGLINITSHQVTLNNGKHDVAKVGSKVAMGTVHTGTPQFLVP